MVVENWDGSAWHVIIAARRARQRELDGVSADATNDVWAAGIQTNQALAMHWNGHRWSHARF